MGTFRFSCLALCNALTTQLQCFIWREEWFSIDFRKTKIRNSTQPNMFGITHAKEHIEAKTTET